MTYSKRFSSKFFAKMLQPAGPNNPVRDRATSLSMVFEILDEKKNKDFFIVETGCMRADHGQLALGDDGASTYIFDDFINYYDGEVASVDINPDNVAHAQKMVSDKTQVYCSDSVEFLWNIPAKRKIDLLYLDSFDFEPEDPIPSQKHHLKELTAVMKNLRKGSIIMVDDNLNTPEFEWFTKIAQGGKAGFVKEFMKDIGAELLLDEYQIIWRL
jgi:hypothetical protein|tara:strand:+ start:975 stop:1616 length:642 start_codon:yes stop_codon:yes gene_type:complete